MRREQDAILSLQRFFAGILPEPWDVRLTVEAGQEPQRPYALIEQISPAGSDGSKNVQDVTVPYTANLYLERGASRAAADQATLDLREQVWQAVKWGDLHRPTTDRIPFYSYEPRSELQRIRVRDATAGTWRASRDGATWTAPIAHDATAADVQAALDALQANVMQVVPRGTGVFDVFFIGALAGVDVAPLELDTVALTGPANVTVVLEGAPAPWRSQSDFMRVESFGQATIRDPDDPALVQVAVDLRCTFARTLPLPFDVMLLQRISATNGIGG